MPAYTITEIQGEPRTDDHGNVSAFVRLEGVKDGALLRKRPPFPSVGDTLDAAYELKEQPKKSGDGTYLKLVRPNMNQAGGGGQGAKDWEASGRAQGRAHAQEMALRYSELKGKSDVSWDDLMKLADKFYDDAQAAKAAGYRT